MKLQQLIYFVEVCESGSISKASTRLYVSQPSISTAIKELEKTCETTLFRRVNKKLYITPEGQHLYRKAIVIIKEMTDLKDELRMLSSAKQSIKLGLPMQVSSFLLPKLLGDFCNLYPHIQLDILELPSLELLDLLEKEQLDMAILGYEDPHHYQAVFQTLFHSEFCLFVHPDNPLSKQDSIAIEEVGDEPLILPTKTHLIHGAVLQRFSVAHCKANVIMDSTNLHTISTLISHNLASAFLLRPTDLGSVPHKKVSLTPSIPAQVSVATAKGAELSPQTSLLLSFLKDVCSNM